MLICCGFLGFLNLVLAITEHAVECPDIRIAGTVKESCAGRFQANAGIPLCQILQTGAELILLIQKSQIDTGSCQFLMNQSKIRHRVDRKRLVLSRKKERLKLLICDVIIQRPVDAFGFGGVKCFPDGIVRTVYRRLDLTNAVATVAANLRISR